MYKEAGVSLIEATVTLSIVAILAAIGLAPLQELTRQRRADATITSLRADLTLARTAAIMNGHSVVICPRTISNECASSLAWEQGWVVRAIGTSSDEAEPVLRVGELPVNSGLVLHSNRKFLRFRSDGTSAGSNQTLRICVNGRQRATLIINNGGRPRSVRTVPHIPC